MEKNWTTFESYSRSPNMFGLELLRTNNPHKYSTLALSLGFWEGAGCVFPGDVFTLSESWQIQPLFGHPKGEIFGTSILGCSRGQYISQTRHYWGEHVQNYHTFASSLIPPQMGFLEWPPGDALPVTVTFANEALVSRIPEPEKM